MCFQQEINNLRHTTELYEAVKIDKKQLEIEIYQLKDQLHRVMEHNDKLIKLNGELDQKLASGSGRSRAQEKVTRPQLVTPAAPGQVPGLSASGPTLMQEVCQNHRCKEELWTAEATEASSGFPLKRATCMLDVACFQETLIDLGSSPQFEGASPVELRSIASSSPTSEDEAVDTAEKYSFEYSQVHLTHRYSNRNCFL